MITGNIEDGLYPRIAMDFIQNKLIIDKPT
jgi:hypothetical protein